MDVCLLPNFIHVTFKSDTKAGVTQYIGFKDIDYEFVEIIKSENKIKRVQISEALPSEAYQKIDNILAVRPNIKFRIFGLYEYEKFDISFLKKMPHLRHLKIDRNLKTSPNMFDFNLLKDFIRKI